MTHTLILDIGKTNAKLLLISEAGEVLARQVMANEAVLGADYLELGVGALEAWLLRTIPTLPQRERIAHINISTHGAAFCAIDGERLVLPPLDYEWDGYGAHRGAFLRLADGFEATGSPDLPLGLNAGLQLYWLQQTKPAAWQRIRHWLPYPQYWAWWFSGVAASEVSSLGCHTHLWSPERQLAAAWAQRAGIAALFAPLKKAWEVLGPVKPELAARLQLPATCQVHVGVHDSNACLARHLHAVPHGTVVSTGTWCVVMAPGGAAALQPGRDELVNVSVEGGPVPTARFMGGREFAALCDGADLALATLAALDEVLAKGWAATPSFAEAGPCQGQQGRVWQHGQALAGGTQAVPAHLRPALAALYCADITAELVASLISGNAASAPVVLEGPLAGNPVYTTALSAWLAGRRVLRSTDALEGTARGAWMLADWSARARLSGWYEPLPVVGHGLQQRLHRYRDLRTALPAAT
jgi:L-fuculokinase